jgi:metal-dependent amidase/aminoacylase/carboxypeptidase family protein
VVVRPLKLPSSPRSFSTHSPLSFPPFPDNLIAISGILALLTLRHALITHHIPGTLVLLGTPAEEGGGGKIPLLKSGAYDGASAVLMCHPGPGRTEEERNWGSVRPSLAIQTLNVDFMGRR